MSSMGQDPSGPESFTTLSPFFSLSHGQWQPEESEDYVSNRCASVGKTGSGWAHGTLPLSLLSSQPVLPRSTGHQPHPEKIGV